MHWRFEKNLYCKNFNIKKVKTSHRKGEIELLSETIIDEDKLRKVIHDTGYTLISIKQEDYMKKGLFS